MVYGEQKAINTFLENYYGYHYDDVGVVAIVFLAYSLIFARAFALATEKLNFQKSKKDAATDS